MIWNRNAAAAHSRHQAYATTGCGTHDCGLEPAGRVAQGRRLAPERAIDGRALSFVQRPARDRILNCRRDRTGFLRR